MENKVKCIGVLTSGGDAQGMNAAIRAVVRHANNIGIKVYGVYGGYRGLVYDEPGDIVVMEPKSVANVLDRGGTMLHSARCPEFKEMWAMEKAIETCKRYGIEGLVTIGGDGTFRGARDLCSLGLPCVGIPATIDNDITCTDKTIGFDTATNFTIQCIDNLRETDESHARCNVIEVMGRNAGYIAAYAGLACGAVGTVIMEDKSFDEKKLLEKIKTCREHGKRNIMVVVAEGVDGYSEKIAKLIPAETGIETKFVRLAHIVRGGSPTLSDRTLATRLGVRAVNLLNEGHKNVFVCKRYGKTVDVDISYAIINDKMYKSSFNPSVKAPTAKELEQFTEEEIENMKELCKIREAELTELIEVTDTTSAF